MINGEDLDDAVIDLRQASFGRGTKIKVQLKAVKALTQIDTSKFKAGHAYRIKKQSESAFFINAIGYHPLDALPTGFGFICSESTSEAAYIHLHELSGEVFF